MRVSARMVVDTMIFCVAVLTGTLIYLIERSNAQELLDSFGNFVPGTILGGVAFACVIYMTGFTRRRVTGRGCSGG